MQKMHLEFELKSERHNDFYWEISSPKESGMYSIAFLTASSQTRGCDEGLGRMNVLGKTTYLCTLKAQPG